MSARPGPWLRLTAIAGAAGVAVVVATGSWGLAHDVAAHVTLALLAATALTARLAHPDRPELLWTAAASFLLFSAAGLAALVDAPTWLHVAFGAAALVAAAVCVAVSFRGGQAGAARVVARLRHADEAADHGAPPHHRGGGSRRRRGRVALVRAWRSPRWAAWRSRAAERARSTTSSTATSTPT